MENLVGVYSLPMPVLGMHLPFRAMSSPSVSRSVDLSRTYALLDEALWSASHILERSIRTTEADGTSGDFGFEDGRNRIRELEPIFVGLAAKFAPLPG